MRKKEEPKRPHTLKTAGREATGRAKGFGLSFLGILTMITGIIVFILALEGSITDKGIIIGFIIFVVGLIFWGTGNYTRQKARHVAWTQEAIERERYASGKEMKCPKCGTWNSKESNYCSECSLPLKIKCLKCGEYNSRGDKFCAKCGSPVEAVEG